MTTLLKKASLGWDVGLLPDAHALRPVRIFPKRDEIRYYEATTFPENPWKGCELTLRRCKACGFLVEDNASDLIIDVLDKNGSIIQDYCITTEGFNYLRRILKFKVDGDD